MMNIQNPRNSANGRCRLEQPEQRAALSDSMLNFTPGVFFELRDQLRRALFDEPGSHFSLFLSSTSSALPLFFSPPT